MAQEAEQISIQVGERSDHTPAPPWDLGHKANHILCTTKKVACLSPSSSLSLRISLCFPGQIPLTP